MSVLIIQRAFAHGRAFLAWPNLTKAVLSPLAQEGHIASRPKRLRINDNLAMHCTIAHILSFEVQKASHMHEATAFKDAVELGSLYQHVRSCVSISISKVARVGFTTFKAWRTLDDLEQRPLLQQARSKMCFSIMEVWCKCDASIRAIRTTRALHCLLA